MIVACSRRRSHALLPDLISPRASSSALRSAGGGFAGTWEARAYIVKSIWARGRAPWEIFGGKEQKLKSSAPICEQKLKSWRGWRTEQKLKSAGPP